MRGDDYVAKPIIVSGFGARGQIDIVNMSSLREWNEGFRYWFCYVDCGTKLFLQVTHQNTH